MIDSLLSHIAPHYCFGCNKQGSLLCENCKYDIISEPFTGCIVCGRITAGHSGLCAECHKPYVRAWCVGERVDMLKDLINGYKFENMKSAHKVLGDLLSERIGQLPASTILVPVPTIPSHIRQRGYDHTLLIARYLAKKHHLRISRSLYRITNTKQREASRPERIRQAKTSFAAVPLPQFDVPYLLIDDVVTTGATVHYAAEALKQQGATEVWVAVIARQPLD